MTLMQVAFHLRKRSEPEPSSAILLETDRIEDLVEFASKLGLTRTPPVYRVPGGFLLTFREAVEPIPGPVKLRALADHLYLPVDSDLVPALLDDEAQGLTRDRGLIFLPGGRVLGFEPGAPLAVSSLVKADRLDGSGWRSFPNRPSRAERLWEITLEPSEASGRDFFEPRAELATEIGSEGPPRPDDAGMAATLAGRAALGAGKGLIGLGSILGIKGLADLGAKWINLAVDRVPRLTEAMIGKQEGALRELLRQFREGDIERALRHALPLGGSGGQGGTPSVNDQLPMVDPTYSLRSLLGSNRGPIGIWFGGYNVQIELAKEYRKAAEEAERKGDFRRAAYIQGKLLNDFATAAHLLSRGGLHRDAAYLYLNRLSDIPAAARAFEAAGELDRALQLYRRERLHAEAGDLLRRVGEEEAAIEEYRWAAHLLSNQSKPDLLAAGDLISDRALRPDLALGYYAKGWLCRPSSDSAAFALRMASIYADSGDIMPLLALLDEADTFFRKPGPEAPALEFYNELARLADREPISEIRSDLLDRSLMGLGWKLREQISSVRKPGQLASSYFGRNQIWSTDLVVDATYAIRAAVDLEIERRKLSKMILGPISRGGSRRIEIDGGTVSAACHSASTGEVFIGFEGGRVYRFNAASGVVSCMSDERLPVSSMAVDPEGRTLVLLIGEGPGPKRLVHLYRVPASSTGWARGLRMIDGPGDFWLTPVMADGPVHAVGVWNGEEMILMGGVDDLALWMRLPMPFLKTAPPAALLAPPVDGRPPSPRAVLVHDGPDICQVESTGKMVPRRRYLGWRPTLPGGHTLRSAPLAWIHVEPERFELAGLDREGVICWSSLKVTDAELIRLSNNESKGETIYFATTLVRAGLVAGVTHGRVDWLRCGPNVFTPVGSTELFAHSPMICFPAHGLDELIVVCRDGTLHCIPIPR